MSATEAHEQAPFIDYENLPTPTEGVLLTQFITVRSVARSRAFYSEVLGGQVVLEENLQGGRVHHAADRRGAEIRCYMRDPDGYMIEVGQATGVLQGQLATKRPEDLPG